MRRLGSRKALIDSDGNMLDAQLQWEISGLTQALSLRSFMDYRCRNFGDIAIEADQGNACLSLSPIRVTEIGLISLLYHLAEAKHADRYLLRIFHGEWAHSIVPDFDGLLERIERYLPSQSPDNYIRKPIPLYDVRQPAIQRIVDRWREGALDISSADKLAEEIEPFCHQYMIIRHSGDSELTFEGVGKGRYAVLGGVGLGPLAGCSLNQTANKPYVARAVEVYLTTLFRPAPVIDKVDALSRMNGGCNLERLRYWRLSIPQQLNNGETLLLSLSVDDASIDLRSDAA